MNVLIDIEWIEENNLSTITQFHAERVSEQWETLDVFDRLVRHAEMWNTDWEHMAYNGYSPDEFRIGVDEETCILNFQKFLQEEDTLICWHKNTKNLLLQKMILFTGKAFPNKCVCVNRKICELANDRELSVHSLYETADGLGIFTPAPQHMSVNDVFVMRCVLSELKYSPELMQATDINKTKERNRSERIADILSRVQYNYIYSTNSKIFHKPTCRYIRQISDIKGCVYYKTAVKSRTPCKVCLPELINPEYNISANENQDKPEIKKPIEKKVIVARLLGDQKIEIANVNLVGFCHNTIHPGNLTRKILEEHDCIGKNCRFFEKYEYSNYWIAEANRCKQKEKRKQVQSAKKQAEKKRQKELEDLKMRFQSYADNAGYQMLIVRLEKEMPNSYKIFYVSDNPFADGNRFPNFLASIKHFFPRAFITLRHIKDTDGHFVTITEFLEKRK